MPLLMIFSSDLAGGYTLINPSLFVTVAAKNEIKFSKDQFGNSEIPKWPTTKWPGNNFSTELSAKCNRVLNDCHPLFIYRTQPFSLKARLVLRLFSDNLRLKSILSLFQHLKGTPMKLIWNAHFVSRSGSWKPCRTPEEQDNFLTDG